MANNYSMVTEKAHGKTIDKIEADTVNHWVIHFTDGSKMEIEAEVRWTQVGNLPVMSPTFQD